MGSCGMHDGARKAVHKAMNTGYYWPSMHRDANNEITSCDSCQVYATIPRLPKNDMISVTSAWPFQKWGMDIVGPILEALGKIKYLILTVDYFTKWLEAKPVTSITGKQVKNFTFDNIVCMFGVPATIITYNETQLINDPIQILGRGARNKNCLHIPISSSSKRGGGTSQPKHNARDQNEIASRRSSIVIPAKIGIPTRRIIQRLEEENEEALQLNLNLLEERREITNELSKVENTGKLGPKWEGPYEIIKIYGTGAYKLRSMEGAEIPRTWHSSNLQKYYM
ncbi:reverse transcriptase domain-containing protein [Tanacetum coccineum]|uniref:Reverse transcriptase domain-containing protein n=1 Tax=Tanacetum coccineum TaxID=301880 RepID=A0ABQ5J8N4_9ASTR